MARDKKKEKKNIPKRFAINDYFPLHHCATIKLNIFFFFFEVVAQLLVGWNVENVYDGHDISVSMEFYGVAFFFLSISVVCT